MEAVILLVALGLVVSASMFVFIQRTRTKKQVKVGANDHIFKELKDSHKLRYTEGKPRTIVNTGVNSLYSTRANTPVKTAVAATNTTPAQSASSSDLLSDFATAYVIASAFSHKSEAPAVERESQTISATSTPESKSSWGFDDSDSRSSASSSFSSSDSDSSWSSSSSDSSGPSSDW